MPPQHAAPEYSRTTVAYMEAGSDLPRSRGVVFNDLIAAREPEFVLLHEGDLLLTLRSDPRGRPGRCWMLSGLYRVVRFEETGDAFTFGLDLLRDFASAGDARAEEVILEEQEMTAALGWFPRPAPFFKPFPSRAWRWLREEKAVGLPRLDPASDPGTGPVPGR